MLDPNESLKVCDVSMLVVASLTPWKHLGRDHITVISFPSLVDTFENLLVLFAIKPAVKALAFHVRARVVAVL